MTPPPTPVTPSPLAAPPLPAATPLLGTPPAALDLDYGALVAGWATLLGCALLVLAAVGAVAWATNRRTPARHPAPGECARLRARAQALAQQAATATTKSAQAHADAEAAQARCVQAQQAREAAWLAHDRAQQAHAAARRAVPADLPTPAETADSPIASDVSRAALAAFRRGDLSVDELREVWRRAGGWDPAREQRDHELMIARAEEHRTQRAYHLAATAERTACREADVAEVAARALAEEAATAIEEAQAAWALAEECRRAARGRRSGRRTRK